MNSYLAQEGTVTQTSLAEGDPDPTLYFGPASIALSSLFKDGWRLEANWVARPPGIALYPRHWCRITLVKGGTRYIVTKVNWLDVARGDKTLVKLVESWRNRRFQYEKRIVFETVELVVEHVERVPPPDLLVGNRLLSEHLKEFLK